MASKAGSRPASRPSRSDLLALRDHELEVSRRRLPRADRTAWDPPRARARFVDGRRSPLGFERCEQRVANRWRVGDPVEGAELDDHAALFGDAHFDRGTGSDFAVAV